jgi:dienelactone hydrolase
MIRRRARWIAAATVAVAWVSAGPARGAENAPDVPIAAFVADGAFSRPSLSPDGRLLAVIVDMPVEGRTVPTLSVFEVPGLRLVARLKMPVREVAIEHHWVSNQRLLVSNGIEVGRQEAPFATGVVFATDIDGSHQKFLHGPRSEGDVETSDGSVHRLPSMANGHFYLRQDRREDRQWKSVLFKVDSLTAERTRVLTLPMRGLSFVMLSDGRVGAAFGTDENDGHVLYRTQGSATTLVDPVAGESSLPFAFTGDASRAYGLLSKDGAPIVLTSEPADGTARSVLAEAGAGSIDIVLSGPPPAQPFAVASHVGRPVLQYLAEDRPEARLHRALAAQFPGSFVDFTGFSDDGGRLLFNVRSDRDPGTYYLWERATGQAQPLFGNLPGIDPERMGERRPIAFDARDGLRLHGYLTLPAGREPRALPMVLLPHGGPHGVSDTWFFDADAQFLASRGYAVMQVNFRGSDGRGPKFRDSGYRQWGDKVQEDLIDAVEWAGRSGMVDAGRVCVVGTSFGAYSAMMAAAKAPRAFKCAAGMAGLYDLPKWFDEPRFLRDPVSRRQLARYFGDDPKEQQRISPTRVAPGIEAPVLLIHGDRDFTTPIAQGEAMRDALRRAGKNVEWVDVSGEGHGFYARKNQEALYRRLEAFLARYLR